MTSEERTTLESLTLTVSGLVAQMANVIARQRRQEDIGAEHHEDIKTILASLRATSAAVTVLMHARYEKKGSL